MSSSDAQTLTVIIFIGVTIVIFLLCREIICWYFKINERLRLQTRQVNLTILLIKELRGDKTTDLHDPAELDDLLKSEIEP
jgi:hypothetical protein